MDLKCGVLLFLSLTSVWCVCPPGWSGDICDVDIDECNITFPCENNASCINLPGRYRCNCLPGYNGSNCELNVNDCLSRPCLNGATCFDLVNTFRCQCPKDYSGPTCSCGPCKNNASCRQTNPITHQCQCRHGYGGVRCEFLKLINFGENSFLEMPYGRLYPDEIVTFSFKTTLPDGLLLYQGGDTNKERTDHVAIELVNGTLRISFNTNTDTKTATVGQVLNDGNFHYVQLKLQDRNPFQATLSVDSAHSVTVPGTQAASFTGHLNLGGLRQYVAQIRYNLVSAKNFIGCIKDFVQNRIPVNFDRVLGSSRNVHAGCSRQDVCLGHKCHQGACVDLWLNYTCKCKFGFLGPYCTQQSSAFFKSSDHTAEVFTSFHPVTSFAFNFSVKTGSGGGILVYTEDVNPGQLGVSIEGTHLKIVYGRSFSWQVKRVGDNITNGSWHHFKMAVRNDHITVSIDNVDTLINASSIKNVGQRLYFGTISPSFFELTIELPGTSFTGCLSDVILNDVKIQLESGQRVSTSPLPTPGCLQGSGCTMNVCQNGGRCLSSWNGPVCHCSASYHGDRCQNATASTFNDSTSSIQLTLDSFLWSFGSSGSLMFKTRSSSGVILYAGLLTRQDYFKLELENGNVALTVDLGSGDGRATVNHAIADNQWHAVKWSRKYKHLVVIVDGDKRAESWITGRETVLNIEDNGKIYVNISSPYNSSMFRGCLKDLIFDTRPVQYLDATLQPGLAVTSVGIRTGCHMPSVCEGYRCQNRATCIEVAGNPQCLCPRNFTGTFCERCTQGRTGIYCERRIDQCASGPCSHNATCLFDPLDLLQNYTCQCLRGYTGITCETEINECLSNPCLNGSCVDNLNSYECRCFKGFSGQNCENEVNECQSAACVNGGTCKDHVGNYSCECIRGYTGWKCEVSVDECASVPCLHGATCIDSVGDYSCNCTIGYKGRNCETEIDECVVLLPCLNGATCIDSVGDYSCICAKGYTDINCSREMNKCLSRPCQHGGNCKDLIGNYSCECVLGYSGRNCEKETDECKPKPCQHGGNCKDLIGNYSCECVLGYSGGNCEKETDECKPKPCQNGGNCKDLIGNYSCECVLGYSGRNCEEETDECKSKPCQHGGNCKDLIGNYSCECVLGYSGRNCEKEIKECESKPCQHGGKCKDLIGKYSCECGQGYNGNNCEKQINECESRPCLNNGVCDNSIAGYSCTCFKGYVGQQCEHDFDECASNPCLNNGVCIDGRDNFVCNCSGSGFRGLRCDQDIDECMTRRHQCQNGTCVNLIGRYECECFEFYEGTFCDSITAKPTSESGNRSSYSDDVLAQKYMYWLVIVFGVLVVFICTVIIVCYRRRHALKTNGVYLPGQEEVRMATIFDLRTDEESVI